MPVSPKFGVGADFNGVHPLGNREWLYLGALAPFLLLGGEHELVPTASEQF
jgi:hypothetical protein